MYHYRVVPHTSNRYFFNDEAKLLDNHTGGVIEPVLSEGVSVVAIMIDGSPLTIRLSVLMLIAFKVINIPKSSWSYIEPIFVDGDELNETPSNLEYRFSRPIEIKQRPGFFYVPYYTKYGITKKGVLVNIKKGNVKSWYIEPPGKDKKKNIRGGYRITSIVRDTGGRTNAKRHRLLALTFKEYLVPPDTIIVNHKNGVGGEDHLNNIEWSTYSKNTLHAYAHGLYSNKAVGLLVKYEDSGKIERYNTIAEFCRVANQDHSKISQRLKTNPGKKSKDGFSVKPDGDDYPWVDEYIATITTESIIVHNVFTGVNTMTNDQNAAAIFSGVTRENVGRILNKNSMIPCKGYLFKRASSEEIVFPKFNRWQLELFKMDRVKSDIPGWIVKDKHSGEEQLYLACEYSKVINKSISQTNLRLKTGTSPCGRYEFNIVMPYSV